jgi:2-polyprenyl-3-methyl-5-hydroxy-6-metoxy-1,4-benzoquinol methylase
MRTARRCQKELRCVHQKDWIEFAAMTHQTVAYRGRVKYTEAAARKYQTRKPAKHRAEMRLIDRAFALIPKTHRVLDVPCGGGRVTVHLAERGYRVSAADLSEAMLEIAREHVAERHVDCAVQRQDIEKLTYADGAFDTVVSFRLFHHFPTAEIRQRVVNELCRVARHNVVLSYFSPLSFTSVKRKLRAATGGRDSQKYPTPLSEVEAYFKSAGFRLVKNFAQTPLVHTLHVAVFERAQGHRR